MDNICDNCGFIMEERLNIYGTYCTKCGAFVPVSKRPKFVIEYENKLKVLRDEFLKFEHSLSLWQELLTNSFLSKKMCSRYEELIKERWQRLND